MIVSDCTKVGMWTNLFFINQSIIILPQQSQFTVVVVIVVVG